MGIQIQPYLPADEPAVKAFNARLRAGGVRDFKLPERHRSAWLPRLGEEPLYEEFFLAKEGAEVRGGYILKHQPFLIAGEVTSVGYLYSPVSEALVDARYGAVGLQLFLHVQRRQPLLYCLGMGGMENALPQMLKAAGWKRCEVPFLFRVVNAGAFLKNIRILRRNALRRFGLDALAATGLGAVGIKLLQSRQPAAASEHCAGHLVDEFDERVNGVWEQGRQEYQLAAVRDVETLRKLYPQAKEKFLKLVVTEDGQPIGWAVMLDTQLSDHKHFGNLRLGSVVDGFAVPGKERVVANAATGLLQARGVDLMVTNQAHAAWVAAFRACGWLGGPSNFIFGASPKLAQKLGDFEATRARLHLTRGDGEGPTHL